MVTHPLRVHREHGRIALPTCVLHREHHQRYVIRCVSEPTILRLSVLMRCQGMALLLYCQTVALIFELRKSERTFMDKFMMGFVTVLLVLNTIYWATQTYFGEMMWITHADFPGGADAYAGTHASVWYQTWGTTASVLSNLMSDALLVSRSVVANVVFPSDVCEDIQMFRDLEQQACHHCARSYLARVSRYAMKSCGCSRNISLTWVSISVWYRTPL